MGIFGVRLSHLTALLTSIIIGVGVDFAVHYISSYRRHSREEKDISKLSYLTMNDVGYPIMLDVVSNMGFAALLFSDLVPLNYMGGLMIFAMLSTSFGTFLLMGTTIEILKNRMRSI
jgi:predicted RND superfamily exporter protein